MITIILEIHPDSPPGLITPSSIRENNMFWNAPHAFHNIPGVNEVLEKM
jgi:hypothetical protein